MSRANGTKRGWRAGLLVAGVLAQLGLSVPGQIRAQSASPSAPPPIVSTADPKAEAKGKLLRARAQLGQGNLDAAEAAAVEVARLGLTFKFNEDSPAKLLADLDKARKDPRAMLQASRAAIARKDLDAAERYARLAEKSATVFTFAAWGDSPSKALKDVAAARAAGPQAATGPKAATPGSSDDAARGLVKKARAALAAGKPDEARKFAAEAAALKPNLGWWDDTPDKVLADLNRLDPSGKPAVVTAKDPSPAAFDNMARGLVKKARAALAAGKPDEARKFAAEAAALKPNLGPTEDTPERVLADLKPAAGGAGTPTVITASTGIPRTKPDAVRLLAEGRKALADGKIDEAGSIAQRCKAATGLSWGLFEDNPSSLSREVDRARSRRDRDEAARLLAKGRELLARGEHEEASRLAFRSQTLFNGYSAWDLGDRPNRLLADCQAVKARDAGVPKLPPTAVVRQQPAPPVPGLTAPPGALPLPSPNLTAMTTPPATVPRAPATAPAVPANKLRAQQLVAEARRLHGEGKLVEAKAKADEAMRLNVTFSGDEASPALVYQQVATEARRRVEVMSREASDLSAHGVGDRAAREQVAERKLTDARALAAAFGQDTGPIDAQLTALRGTPGARPLPALPPVGSGLPPVQTVGHTAVRPAHGQQLLENARAELKRGEVATARKMAEEALTGNHGVKDQAMDLLRTIDVEEFNQKRLTANRSFDAVEAAYRRREYAQAQAMLAMIDSRLLDASRQSRLREINLTPEMGPGTAPKSTPGTAVASDRTPGADGLGGTLVRTAGPSMPGTLGAGKASATDAPAPSIQDEYKQRQTAMFQMMRQKGLDAQSQAGEKFRTGQHAAALEVLQEFLNEVSDSRLEASQASLLRRPVESRLSQYRLIKAQKDMVAGINASRTAGQDRVMKKRQAEDLKRKNVEDLMRQYNAKFTSKDFAGAMALASRAHDLDPDNPVVTAALTIARRQSNLDEYNKVKESRGEMHRVALNDAENQPGTEAIRTGVSFDKDRWEEAKKRQGFGPQRIGKTGTKERAIESKLLAPVNLNFENTPLKQVIDDLRDFHGINIVPDLPALQSQGTHLDSPISIKLDQVSLKSALNLILHQVKLTYVIKDEVLQITTEENAKGKLVTVTYQVADLVVPMENHMPGASADAPTNSAPTIQYAPTPTTSGPSLTGGTPTGTSTPSSMSSGGTSTTMRKPTNTQEEQLIKLITQSISPKSWSDVGGAGTIEFYPITFGLVINQTPDIQEQIQDLLTALRRLQDQSVAIEVRLITVSEDFFERIGVNFAMNILTDKANRQFEPQLLNGNFVSDPARFINAFDPKRFIAGLTPAGTLTPTLDIPITQQSFYQTFPTFGNYTGGGLNIGLAFLSDIQVFLMLEALQGDTRSNVMQAPRITAANGQSALIQIQDVVRNVVTGVSVVGLPGGQFAFQPQTSAAPIGGSVTLSVQPLITDDRRFVRISAPLTLTSTTPGPIPVFPLVVPLFSSLDGVVQTGQPVVFTQYIQQPRITTLSVQTEVRIPDGGTVVLGGLKRMSEARTEFGPPVLSKIPYVNRLFKNVGYGKETESLLIMITARIIVLAEEQERATGFVPTEASGTP